jgi:membrane associated rhomboid family serine protease
VAREEVQVFPYRDDNPRVSPPLVTGALIGANLLAWAVLEGLGSQLAVARAVCALGLIPGALLGEIPAGATVPLGEGLGCTIGAVPAWVTPLTSMFLHGGWFHLIGNIWFLWLFGDNVEDAMGHVRYGVFYLLSGLAAAGAQVLANPGSPLPMVGASGAISGIMGAYAMLYPRVRVHLWVFLGFFITRAIVPAYVMLLYWFMLQLVGSSVAALQAPGGGVAFAAHAGGFIAGAVLVGLFKNPALLARRERLLATL